MSTTRLTPTPAGLPVLQPGRHSTPEHGGCVMEIASLLAGEAWSDHPRCTQRLVAVLARTVNDAISPTTRQHLAPWIPALVTAHRNHPLITASLMATIAQEGLHARPHDRILRWAAQHAQRRIAGWHSRRYTQRGWLRLSDPLVRLSSGLWGTRAVTALTAHDPHIALARLLTQTLTAYHQADQQLQPNRPTEPTPNDEPSLPTN